jgi:hypothetical protein
MLRIAGRHRVRDTASTAAAHIIVSGKPARAARFPKSVVFKSFTLFPTFPLFLPAEQRRDPPRKPVG